MRRRFKQLQHHYEVTGVGETEGLKKENRRLRAMLAEASAERGALIEEIRARAPFERFDKAPALALEA